MQNQGVAFKRCSIVSYFVESFAMDSLLFFLALQCLFILFTLDSFFVDLCSVSLRISYRCEIDHIEAFRTIIRLQFKSSNTRQNDACDGKKGTFVCVANGKRKKCICKKCVHLSVNESFVVSQRKFWNQ